MEELVWLARGVTSCGVFSFLVGLFGFEKWFGTWEIDRKTVIMMALVMVFTGAVLLAVGGAV